jgi:hypothetical protein
MNRVVLYLVQLILLAGIVAAQTAQIMARVEDSSSGVIPGASVTVTNIDTGSFQPYQGQLRMGWSPRASNNPGPTARESKLTSVDSVLNK